MQSILSVLYPRQCIACETLVVEGAALCPTCWRDTPFIQGACCIKCGAPLMGDAPGDDVAKCDDCLVTARPWSTGVSALVYKGIARRLILGLKHGDRSDLVGPFASWVEGRLRTSMTEKDVILPVPIHWRRMIKRKFNQSGLISKKISISTGAEYLPDALIRVRHTRPQEGLSFQERFELQSGSIRPHGTRSKYLHGRRVFIVDDVMTSGATLAAATKAVMAAGANEVHTLTLARVVKDY